MSDRCHSTACKRISTAQPERQSSDTLQPGVRSWVVKHHPKVAKKITRFGLSNHSFRSTISELLERLKHDPKQNASLALQMPFSTTESPGGQFSYSRKQNGP